MLLILLIDAGLLQIVGTLAGGARVDLVEDEAILAQHVFIR